MRKDFEVFVDHVTNRAVVRVHPELEQDAQFFNAYERYLGLGSLPSRNSYAKKKKQFFVHVARVKPRTSNFQGFAL